MKSEAISALEEEIGHHFRDPELLVRALTHSSHAHERESGSSARDVSEVLRW